MYRPQLKQQKSKTRKFSRGDRSPSSGAVVSTSSSLRRDKNMHMYRSADRSRKHGGRFNPPPNMNASGKIIPTQRDHPFEIEPQLAAVDVIIRGKNIVADQQQIFGHVEPFMTWRTIANPRIMHTDCEEVNRSADSRSSIFERACMKQGNRKI